MKVMKNKCDIVGMCPVHVSNIFYSVQPRALYVGDGYDESEELITLVILLMMKMIMKQRCQPLRFRRICYGFNALVTALR